MKFLVAGISTAAVVLTSQPAHAYLDPGTGSMILQLLLGGVAGALVVGRLYWRRIKEFFGVKPKGLNDNPQEQTGDHG